MPIAWAAPLGVICSVAPLGPDVHHAFCVYVKAEACGAATIFAAITMSNVAPIVTALRCIAVSFTEPLPSASKKVLLRVSHLTCQERIGRMVEFACYGESDGRHYAIPASRCLRTPSPPVQAMCTGACLIAATSMAFAAPKPGVRASATVGRLKDTKIATRREGSEPSRGSSAGGQVARGVEPRFFSVPYAHGGSSIGCRSKRSSSYKSALAVTVTSTASVGGCGCGQGRPSVDGGC
jgi:hypothetical protein